MGQQAVPAPVAPTTSRQVKVSDAPQASWAKARERLAWIMVAPSVIVVSLVALYPLFQTVRLSFTSARLSGARPEEWVGLQNYTFLFGSNNFISAFWNTVAFTVASVFLETVLGMAVALILHSQFRGRGMLRTAILVPWAIPTVVSSQLWKYMLTSYGVFNDLLQYRLPQLVDWIPFVGARLAGLFPAPGQSVAFLASPNLAMPSSIAVDVWKTTPFMALLLLAGLQIIPDDMYEAARVDGANKWQQFWQMTLPMIRPALLVALVFRTLDAFRVFDVIFVLHGVRLETQTLAIFAQQTLVNGDRLGRTSAAAVFIFACIAVLVVIYTRLVRVEEN